jgi:hypothetical protein
MPVDTHFGPPFVAFLALLFGQTLGSANGDNLVAGAKRAQWTALRHHGYPPWKNLKAGDVAKLQTSRLFRAGISRR